MQTERTALIWAQRRDKQLTHRNFWLKHICATNLFKFITNSPMMINILLEFQNTVYGKEIMYILVQP